MIYLFYGSDINKVRTKAFDWVAAARKKESNLAYVRLAREELSDAALEDAAQAGGLFVQRTLVLIDDPYPPTRGGSASGGKADADEEESDVGRLTSYILDEHIDALAESNNAIVILAPSLPAPKAKKLAAKAKAEYKFDKSASASASWRDVRGFNSSLVDALGARNREKLWMEISRALRKGDSPEMLHGLLHWKARDILEKGSRAWKPAEARKLSLHLISLLQDCRRKSLNLSESLERWALSL